MLKISVIIPTYNRLESLLRALESVQSQSYQATEIIVIDDGSTDQTAEHIKRNFSNVKYIYQSNAGVSTARNAGIEHSSGDWLAFLDSDDKWHKDKLMHQSTLLANNPEYLIIHSDEIWIRNGIRINQKKKHQKKSGYIFHDCLRLCVISPSSVIIHNSIFKDIGLFNQSLPACEDYDLWLRICYKYPVLCANRNLVYKYGGHNDQLSQKYWGMDRFRIRALENIIKCGQLQNKELQLAILTMHEKIKIYQDGAIKRNNHKSATEFQHLLEEYPIKLMATEQ
ncbi:MAG: glycosyltransferase involved in cell wall biosynthesis [Gammaproteobacteria bacterium]|jgi:glycosyltransferase involved in cell wall biosynthesis